MTFKWAERGGNHPETNRFAGMEGVEGPEGSDSHPETNRFARVEGIEWSEGVEKDAEGKDAEGKDAEGKDTEREKGVEKDAEGKDAEGEMRRLMERYGDTINGICYSFAGREREFADLRQDALVNLWRGLRSFRGESDLRTWVYRVTLNSCVSVCRRGMAALPTVGLDVVGERADPAGEEMEQARWVRSLIGRLEATDRAIILMWLDDLSYDEISDVMGMNRNTVASRVRRIKEKLHNMIKDE